MPKKTRKEKILADTRTQGLQFTYSSSSPSKISKTLQQDTAIIIGDLRKTVIIGALFIGFEILLSIFSKKWGW